MVLGSTPVGRVCRWLSGQRRGAEGGRPAHALQDAGMVPPLTRPGGTGRGAAGRAPLCPCFSPAAPLAPAQHPGLQALRSPAPQDFLPCEAGVGSLFFLPRPTWIIITSSMSEIIHLNILPWQVGSMDRAGKAVPRGRAPEAELGPGLCLFPLHTQAAHPLLWVRKHRILMSWLILEVEWPNVRNDGGPSPQKPKPGHV